jgi:uncharacterized protein (TIGR03118 family)
MTALPTLPTPHRLLILAAASVSLLSPPSIKADEDGAERYRQLNLVADQGGVAILQDSDLVNAWGISHGPGTPFWISDNHTGKSTLYAVTYDSSGAVSVVKAELFVDFPAGGDPTGGSPTGQLFNDTGAFNGDAFIFSSEDGAISGWRGALGTTPGTPVETLTARDGAVYKGITLAHTSKGPMLLAANFSEATIDAYDASMNLVQYTEPNAPAGYAPFNIQSVADVFVVTFAKQDDQKMDDDPGRGRGFIDLFDPETGQFTRIATGSEAGGHLHDINSPWGVALAPSTFGAHAGELLIGNFGSGTIMGFDSQSAKFRGLLKAEHGGPVVIHGLWALIFGGGGRDGRPETLYFTAGPAKENQGIFGSLDPLVRHENDDDQGEND